MKRRQERGGKYWDGKEAEMDVEGRGRWREVRRCRRVRTDGNKSA